MGGQILKQKKAALCHRLQMAAIIRTIAGEAAGEDRERLAESLRDIAVTVSGFVVRKEGNVGGGRGGRQAAYCTPRTWTVIWYVHTSDGADGLKVPRS